MARLIHRWPALLLSLAFAGVSLAQTATGSSGPRAAGGAATPPETVQERLRPERLRDRADGTDFTYADQLAELAPPGGLGYAPADTAAIVQRFGAATPDAGLAVQARLEAARQAAALLRDHAAAQAKALQAAAAAQDERALRPATAAAADAPAAARREAAALRVRLARWDALAREFDAVGTRLQALQQESNEQLARQALNAVMPVTRWPAVLRAQANTPVQVEMTGVPVTLLGDIHCDPPPAACTEFDDRVELVRAFNLGRRLNGYLGAGELARHLADANLQTARWESYRTQARRQYFWEVWINGKLMSDDLCPRQDGLATRRGFCAVPSSQWVLMHPEAALTYNRKASRSDELGAALLVEILGYHRWNWRDDTAQMTDRWGVSLAAAWTDHGKGRRWGFGPAVTLGDGYNLAVTRAPGGRYSVLVNVRLADRYFGRRQEVTDYLRRLDK
jgi:hypothetical protein